ncbi:copper resistance protein CopC [Leucobacter sp. HNU]|uniref:copper resistance CopC family protein n=1 Tax=Leucobacter sp. HNU TaxID=3236805 RepID=UPI003A811696
MIRLRVREREGERGNAREPVRRKAHGIRAALAGTALALVAVPFAASAAFAHDSLVSATPAPDATTGAVDSVVLQFNNSPLGLEEGNLVQVIGPDGKYYETSCPTLSATQVTTPVKLGPAGKYEVEWRVVSSDGHPVADRFTFTYTGEPASGAGSETPHCGKAAPAGAGSAASEPAGGERLAETKGAGNGLWIGAGVGGAAVLVVGLGAWVILRKPRAGR